MYFNWIVIGLLNIVLFVLLVSKKSSLCEVELLSSENKEYLWAW